MGKVLIIKGADFSEVSLGKSYASETEELINEAIINDDINILLNEEGSINGNNGQEIVNNDYCRSTYIPINELHNIAFYSSNYSNLGAIYDSSKNFLSVITGITYARFACVHFNDIINTIDDAVYVRLTTLSGIGKLVNTSVSDNNAYKVAMTTKIEELGIGDITSLTKPYIMISNGYEFYYSENQKSILLIPLSSLTGKTITNNGTYSSSASPFSLYKENMQSIDDYSNAVEANVPITVDVDTLISTYSNAVFIAMCVDVRATNPTIVMAQGS